MTVRAKLLIFTLNSYILYEYNTNMEDIGSKMCENSIDYVREL